MKIERYIIDLKVDYEANRYWGTVRAVGDLGSELFMNAKGFKVTGVRGGGRVNYSVSEEGVSIRGELGREVSVEFEGTVQEGLMGFYRASFEGEKFLTTHFEPNGARYFIPLVDLPSVKARFKLTVGVNRDLQVISNMPEERAWREGQWFMHEFQETPPMSTYLLYLGIGNFDYIEDTFKGKKVYLAAYGGRSRRGRFAIEAAKSSLSFYEEYFSIPYMLPKLHLIAVPEFAMGAMENWGAITFRETALLADESSPEDVRRSVATVVAHELAHQWFGDLVTMKWWDDLWLNESFATFMSYKAIDSFHPEWEHWDDFVLGETEPAFVMDSLTTTHPIHVPVEKEEEIEQIFDDISYGKGASVLRMLEGYVGAEGFRKGITGYLKRHSYSNATMDDLWSSIQEATGLPVKDTMGEWVRRAGHPYIRARAASGGLKLEQGAYFYTGLKEGVWPVPVTFYTGGSTTSELLAQRSGTIKASGKLNVRGTGFYRVFYDDWDAAYRGCRDGHDRWNVLSDAFAALYVNEIGVGDYVGLLGRYSNEGSYLPASEASYQSYLLYLIFSGAKGIAQRINESIYKTWKDKEGYTARIFRGVLLRRLATLDARTASELASMDFSSAEPELRGAVAMGMARAGERPFERLSSLYKSAAREEDRPRIITAMLNIHDRGELEKALEFLKGVKKQDLRYFSASTTNVENRAVLWDWFKENLGFLRDVYRGSGVLPRLIYASVPLLAIERPSEAESLFSSTNIPEASFGIKNGLELLQAYLRLRSLLSASTASLK